MGKNNWDVVDETKGDTGEPVCFEAKTSDALFSAFVKWDGCIDFAEHNEENGSAMTQVHVCGADHLDLLIQRLTEVRDLARAKFARHWYGHWRTPSPGTTE